MGDIWITFDSAGEVGHTEGSARTSEWRFSIINSESCIFTTSLIFFNLVVLDPVM